MQDIDFIGQTYWTTMNLKTISIAEKIADLIAKRDDEFAATALFGGKLTKKRNEQYDKTKFNKFIQCILEPDINYVVMTNSDKTKKEVIFAFTISMLNKFSVVSFNVTHNYFNDAQNLNKFLSIGKEIAEIIRPMYGKIHDMEDISQIMGYEAFNLLEKIPNVFWGNYFGEPYINKIGRQKLLSAMVYKVEELQNGDIYLQISNTPFKSSSYKERKIQKNLAKHLGIKKR